MSEPEPSAYILDTSISIDDYLGMLGSESPIPGGGSAAAIVGAIAASLVSMVASVSLKSSNPEQRQQLHEIGNSARRLSNQLRAQSAADQQAFVGYMDAIHLPKSTDQEKVERKAAMSTALISATDVPMETASLCADLLELVSEIEPLATRQIVSDVSVASRLATAAGESALDNVRINIRAMSEGSVRTAYEERAASLAQRLAPAGD